MVYRRLVCLRTGSFSIEDNAVEQRMSMLAAIFGYRYAMLSLDDSPFETHVGIQPGTPWESGSAEKFSSRVRGEFLEFTRFLKTLGSRTRNHGWTRMDMDSEIRVHWCSSVVILVVDQSNVCLSPDLAVPSRLRNDSRAAVGAGCHER
jgi:hypothetical protein